MDGGLSAPPEILARGQRAQRAYAEAAQAGTKKVYRTRLMLVGQERVGKTSLKKALTGQGFDENEAITDGVETTNSCEINIEVAKADGKMWSIHKKGPEDEYNKTIADEIAKRLIVAPPQKQDSLEPLSDTTDGRDLNPEETEEFVLNNVETAKAKKEDDNMPNQIASMVEKKLKEEIRSKEIGLTDSSDSGRGEGVSLSIWDFAGQEIYYTTHQVFLTWRAIYAIVFDLRSFDPDYEMVQGGAKSELTCLEFINFWLCSIFAHAVAPSGQVRNKNLSETAQKSPPIFIVGTHRDSVKGDAKEKKKKIESAFQKIRKSVKKKPFECHVVSKYYAIENSLEDKDEELVVLRRHIEKVAMKEPYMGEEIPHRWLLFEEALAAEKINHMSLAQTKKLTEPFRIESERQLLTMLTFYHDLGYVVYYGGNEDLQSLLRHTVILNPQWLIDVFKKVITILDPDERDGNMSDAWTTLEEDGILEDKLIQHMWQQFSEQKEFLVELMAKFDLICEAPVEQLQQEQQDELDAEVSNDTEKVVKKRYYVPSRIKSHCSQEEIGQIQSSSDFYVDFRGFLPDGLFHRLMARAVRWMGERDGEPVNLFYRHISLMIDEEHHALLEMSPPCEATIKVTVFRGAVADSDHDGDSRKPDPSAVKKVMDFVKRTLDSLRQHWAERIKYDFCFLCPKCSKKKPFQDCFKRKSLQCGLHSIPTAAVKSKFGISEERVESGNEGPMTCRRSTELRSSKLPESFSKIQIETVTETGTTERCASDMSRAGSLRSTEPVAPWMGNPEGQHQVINVHPASQVSNQSSQGALRKRPVGSVQTDPDVSPHQKQRIQQPIDEPPANAKSPTTSGQVGSGQYVGHPSDDESIEPRAPQSSISPINASSPPSAGGQVGRGQYVGHPSDDESLEPRAPQSSISPIDASSLPSGIQDDDDGGGLWLMSTPPESSQSSGQPINGQQESVQSRGRPGHPTQAWPESTTSTQSDKKSPQHSKTRPSYLVSNTSVTSSLGYASGGGASMHTLSSTQSMNIKQCEENIQIFQETGNMSLESIDELFSPKDSLKDGITMSGRYSADVDGITGDLSEMNLEYISAPVNKEKREDEKEKDDDDEKEKCEIEFESEDEEEEVQNMPEATTSASDIESNVLDEKNTYHEEKKEEMPEADVGRFEASEGSWPALEVAQQLSDEKAKKEEEEAKIEYDPTTGIEKALFEKMKEHPESLSPEEHDLIKKQMMQHLQKKANPMKKNEPEIPFDPDNLLSEYQKELGVPGLLGFNYIICAPSRTGKVLTAAMVCNHQRKVGVTKEDKKPFKCLFVTPGDCIKERHRRAFQEVFPQGSVVALDNTSKFREVFDQPSVFVVMLTGVRLSVALDDGDLKFVEVHTMVVDECHLVTNDHPGFGDVIKQYLLEKKLILASKAPKGAWTLGKPYGGISRVIGLTPHLGAGMRQFSKDNIVQQCGLLDSKGIRRIEAVENLTDLLDTNKPPEMDTMLLTVPSRSSSSVKGTFRSVVEKIMSAIEEKFSILPETGGEGEEKKLAHPPYGTTAYTEWIVRLYKESRLCRDEGKYAPAMFLVKLNEVLMVNEDLRPKEAMTQLKEVEKLKTDHAFNGSSGSRCYRMVNEQIPELKRLSLTDHAGLTPKLTCLTQKLAKIYGDDSNALGLVICRCPAVAKYLTKIISENNITLSKGILPIHLEEMGECEDGGEESQKLAQQRVILEEFESDGSYNLVISTDFEQVDLELPDCHFVIRYNVVCEEAGTIHWSGRKKAKKGSCFFITESGTRICRQEETKREALQELEKHLKVLNDMDAKHWYDIVENKQFACLRSVAQRDFVVSFQRFNRRAADYTLVCRNCRKFICNAHFLLKRGTHVSCQDSSIKERLSIAGLTTPIRGSDDDTTGVLKCTGQKDGQPCNNKLGLAIDFKRLEIEEGYGLDAKGFFFSYLEGLHADYVGKEFDQWDDIDFFIYLEDRSDRRRSGGGGGGGGDDDDDGMDDDNQGGGSADGGDYKKKKESGASNVGGGGGGGRTQTRERARGEETQMETENTPGSRQRRPNQDKNVDR